MALPPCGFLCKVLCCRNCQLDGSAYGLSYPRNTKDLNKMGAVWATKALTASKFLPEGVSVATIECVVPETVGLLSELRFATLTYSSSSGASSYADLPTTMVVKFAPPDLITRITTDLFELLRTEFRFYADDTAAKELAKLGIVTPKCFYADMNMRSNNLCILLEKLDGEFKDQLSGSIDLEEAKLVAEVVGKINGKWYGKADAPAIAFANRIDSNVYKIFGPTADGALKKVDRYKQGGAGWTYVIPRDFVGMWPEIKPEFFNILRFLGMTKNVGLTHGDSRSDNFFFYNDAAGVKRCGVLDFQLLLVADVSTDFVYFVGTSMAPEFQKENLEVLVDAYFDALHAGGGPKIEKGSDERAEFEECFDLSVVFMLTKLIVGAGGIDPAVPNAIDLMDLMLKRMIALYEMRNASAAFLKWREGTMLCQKAAGSQCSLDKLGMSPKTIALVNAPVNPIPVW